MSYSITTAEPRKLHSENSECLGSNVSLGSKTESQKFWHNSSHETKQNQGLEVESTTILKEGANTSSNLHPSRLNSVIARAKDGSKFKLEWYHKNYLDHVYAVSDDTGDILEHYRYTAFGEVTIYDQNGNQAATTQIDNHILWNTRRRDEVTGYYLYKFRHYSPELGRWLGRDPIEEQGGINLYAFVGNDGINYWDRLGKRRVKVGLKLVTTAKLELDLVDDIKFTIRCCHEDVCEDFDNRFDKEQYKKYVKGDEVDDTPGLFQKCKYYHIKIPATDLMNGMRIMSLTIEKNTTEAKLEKDIALNEDALILRFEELINDRMRHVAGLKPDLFPIDTEEGCVLHESTVKVDEFSIMFEHEEVDLMEGEAHKAPKIPDPVIRPLDPNKPGPAILK